MGSRMAVRFVVVLLATLAVPAAVAGPGASETLALHGVEVGATPTVGTFAGTGGSKTTWAAVVHHTRIQHGRATIRGGSFRLVRPRGARRPQTLRGTFTGGTVTLVSQDPGCGGQVYAVRGRLVLASGTGALNVRLTHHRRSVLGRCIAYSATVKGTVRL